ncbi:MAG: hypothetical protein CM15mP74_22140 [Halieaceae bacterium]|nr:MAG: hypothetical protein CM15mP74_22140 [Halieaceae bacterium]
MALGAAEVLQPIDTLPLSALSPPSSRVFLTSTVISFELDAHRKLDSVHTKQRAVGHQRGIAVRVAGGGRPLSDLDSTSLTTAARFISLFSGNLRSTCGASWATATVMAVQANSLSMSTFLRADLVPCAGMKSTLWDHALPHHLFTVPILLSQLLMKMACPHSMEERMAADLATASIPLRVKFQFKNSTLGPTRLAERVDRRQRRDSFSNAVY